MADAELHHQWITALSLEGQPCITQVGGKACGLVALMKTGLDVPSTLCVSADAFRAHCASAGLDCSPATEGDTQVFQRLRDAICACAIDDGLADALGSQLQGWGDVPLAVRSSATTEDLRGASFAGQHLSTLGVRGHEPLLDAIKACWASLWSDAAVAYRKALGMPFKRPAMAVLIQPMVAAGAAGVMFTIDPRDGAEDRVVIEAVHGLGEVAARGAADPARFVVSKRDLEILERSAGTQTRQWGVAPRGGLRSRAVTQRQLDRGPLTSAEVRRVAWLGRDIETGLQGPQDIEWALEGDRLWILQSRPCARPVSLEAPTPVAEPPALPSTSLPTPSAAPLSHNGAGRHDARPPVEVDEQHPVAAVNGAARQVWSNLNSGEVLPDVVTPLTWSMLQDIAPLFKHLIRRCGVDIGDHALFGRIAGRVYFNLNTLAAIMRCLPAQVPELEQVFGGAHLASAEHAALRIAAADIPTVRGGLASLLTHLPSMALWMLRHHPRAGWRYVRRMERRRIRLSRIDIRALEPPERSAHIATQFEVLFHPHMLAYPGIGAACFMLLNALTRRWMGREGLANRLLSGCGRVCSADAGLALWALADRAAQTPEVRDAIVQSPDFAALYERLEHATCAADFLSAWSAFMMLHGHHCRGEIELSNARWFEQPDYVLDMIRSYLEMLSVKDAALEYRARAAAREAFTEQCRAGLSRLRRGVFDAVLWRARQGLALRESIKSEAVRSVSMLRQTVLQVGELATQRGWLNHRDDVFFLDRRELLTLAAEETVFDLQDKIRRRRAEHAAHRAMRPPPVVTGSWTPAVQAAGEVAAVSTWQGLAVSGGEATGFARVIQHADGDQTLAANEILVAPFTDPGWTPYFLPAAGIVVDIGGLLSHGSIVARELGIPAVVNVGPASQRIRTGQRLHVDGERGVVRVLD